MVKDYFSCFLSADMKYVLLDGDGMIRNVAYDLRGIMKAKIDRGWGRVHKITFDGKRMNIHRKEIK